MNGVKINFFVPAKLYVHECWNVKFVRVDIWVFLFCLFLSVAFRGSVRKCEAIPQCGAKDKSWVWESVVFLGFFTLSPSRSKKAKHFFSDSILFQSLLYCLFHDNKKIHVLILHWYLVFPEYFNSQKYFFIYSKSLKCYCPVLTRADEFIIGTSLSHDHEDPWVRYVNTFSPCIQTGSTPFPRRSVRDFLRPYRNIR